MAKKETVTTPIAEVAEYKILVDFNGSQDGRFVTGFKAGETAELSAELATVALSEGWAGRL